LQIVAQGAAYVPDPNDIGYEDKPIDAVHSLRRTEKAPVLAAYTTTTTQMFTFPAILSTLTFALLALNTTTQPNRSEPQWVAGVRAAFTVPVICYNNNEFFRTSPAGV